MTNRPGTWHLDVKMDIGFPLQPYLLQSRIQRLSDIVKQKTNTITVVLDGVHDPHNLSAVVRSCEGFGLLDLHVIESNSRFHISSKVTQGSEKWVDIHRHSSPSVCLAKLKQAGFQTWITQPDSKSRRIHELPFQEHLALVFGNEHAGVSCEMERSATGRFHVPMYGFSQSLNVSVAVGIVLSHAVLGRERRPQGHADLSLEEQSALVADWQRRSVKHADKILKRLQSMQTSIVSQKGN